MLSADSIPQARVVRTAGQLVAPPPRPRALRAAAIGEQLRVARAYAVGLWPLTCVVLLMCGLLILAARSGAR
jgi:hypothetical protein